VDRHQNPRGSGHALDHRHADNLAAALALPEDFDGDRFDRVRRSHAAYFAP